MTSHRRIRPFNTRDTYPEQDLDNDLCQAVVAGNTRGRITVGAPAGFVKVGSLMTNGEPPALMARGTTS